MPFDLLRAGRPQAPLHDRLAAPGAADEDHQIRERLRAALEAIARLPGGGSGGGGSSPGGSGDDGIAAVPTAVLDDSGGPGSSDGGSGSSDGGSGSSDG